MQKEITSAMIEQTLKNYSKRTEEISKEMFQSYERIHINPNEFIETATLGREQNDFIKKTNIADATTLYERYQKIMNNNIGDTLVLMATLMDEQETMNRIMTAYDVLPSNEKKLLQFLYQGKTQDKTEAAIHEYSMICSITIRSGYRLRAKAFLHIKKIYQSNLTHAEIYRLRRKSIDEMLSHMEKNNKNK